MATFLTVPESSQVLRDLGYALSERQIRYLDLQPSQRWPGKNGGSLFDETDVTLLAVFAELIAKCRDWGLPLWSARAAITYRETELRHAIRLGTHRYLTVDRIRGDATLADRPNASDYAIDIKDLAQRVTPAVEAYRREHPDVWVGSEEIEASELISA